MSGMSPIVKSMTRIVSSFILLYGVSIVLYGHVTPGGGFAGGVIIASAFILIVLAFGVEYTTKFVARGSVTQWDFGGALGLILIALLGYLGGPFFWNFLRPPGATFPLFRIYSAGSVVFSNAAIGIKVGMGLFGVFLALSIFRRKGRDGDDT